MAPADWIEPRPGNRPILICMPDSLTIVMYHYVRDLERSRFARIKGLTVERFEAQLDHIARHYTVVGEAQVSRFHRDRARPGGAEPLPPNACWLTFDDGFVDHFDTVLPRLVDRGWTGSFYPAAGPVLTGRLLDVHRVHFVLASVEDATAVYDAVVREVEQLGPGGLAAHPPGAPGPDRDQTRPAAPVPSVVPTLSELRAEYFKPNRFDGPEVNFVKRVLQAGLPEEVRSEICARLFARFVSADEADFAAGLYMSIEQLRQMASAGMSIGGHGFRHRWLGELEADQQAIEIDRSLELLKRVQGPRQRPWSMSYPYGSYNARTLELLGQAGCSIGLTTRVGVARPADPPLELPRLDTNDLPQGCGD